MPTLYDALFPRAGDEAWTLTIAVFTSVACALPGCYLVLRRLSLLGDAISHAVLPGLVLAFVFSGSLGIGPMLVGAALTGMATTLLVDVLQRQANVSADSSMGIVFTTLFALGVTLYKLFAHDVDLDIDCVLQGELATASNLRIDFFGMELPRSFVSITPALLLNSAFIALCWKELKITSFDPALAATMGLRTGVIHYALMALVAVTTVGSFEAVGSILVIAMLIVPAATAHLWSDRLSRLVPLAGLFAALAAYVGYVVAYLTDVSPAGAIACASGGLFTLTALFAPRHGFVGAALRNRRFALRIVGEDILAMLYRVEELGAQDQLPVSEALAAVGGGWSARIALRTLQISGDVSRGGNKLTLTERGRRQATRLIRSHRLWEAYLVKHLGLPLDHVHAPAERMEHYIGKRLEEQLAAGLESGAADPHGRTIPEP